MNLQEILSYRDTCIHCGRPMQMHVEGYPKLSAKVTDTGLEIKSDKQNGAYLHFGFDGKFTRNKRNYKVYSKPLVIKKYCHFHPLFSYVTPSQIITGQSSSSSLNHVKDTTCQYEFIIYGNHEIYSSEMSKDFIYWHNDEQFWHANTYFISNRTDVYHATYEHKIDEILRLMLPAMNLRNVKDKDQFIQKLKLYTLFS